MKTSKSSANILVASAFATLLAGNAQADDMGSMTMDKQDKKAGMPMSQPTAAVHGVGVVKGIDSKAATVTLAHQAIPALHWPAMTMAFKVARPELLTGVVVGARVNFDLQGNGMSQTITAITPAN
jgi:Cu(I)/Ag(I) efflux system protein CusF